VDGCKPGGPALVRVSVRLGIVTIAMRLKSTAVAAACVLASAVAVSTESQATPMLGAWRATDPANESLQTIVELFIVNDRLHGRLVQMLHNGRPIDPICEMCPDGLQGKNVIGSIFISNLRKESDVKWVDGKVIDLRAGKYQGWTVNCELELVDGRIRIFGYPWIFRAWGRSDYWERVDGVPTR
jgi:hypothetical protein